MREDRPPLPTTNAFLEGYRRDLGVEARFYHAALLHLVLAKIHPFEDGDGRVARLLEKGFLSEQRGTKAGKGPPEELYWENHPLPARHALPA
jgi:Fic family protein